VGCSSCGGGRPGQTIGQRSAQQRAARSGASPLGTDQSNPVLLGEADDKLRRVRVIIPVGGLARSQQAWVTGRDVDGHIASGALHDITDTAQKRRMWRVPGMPYPYLSWQEASRVAAGLGTTPIEVA
jgi:hypothetical protein